MKIARTVQEIRDQVREWKLKDESIGLVPTMGYLHEGHESLIRRAREENDHVAVSIFVNPTQFGENEDLDSYPRDFQRDKALCEKLGTDLIFCPEPDEMYQDPKAYVNIEDMQDHLCGASRPVHFRGVCTVCSKLFNIVEPTRAYFGQKDAQQLAIIKKMVKDLNFNLEIVGCSIVREESGLAKSSRNKYLSEEETKQALSLSKAIAEGKRLIKARMKSRELIEAMTKIIEKEPLAKIDYIEVVDAETMNPLETVDREVLVAMAVYIGSTRLIDNFSFDPEV